MYDRKLHLWKSDGYDEKILDWARQPGNAENAEAIFVLADDALAKIEPGTRTADAVYLMERAANLGYGQAALAMGQMFQFGWGVKESRKEAQKWYQRAEALGCADAKAFLQDLTAKAHGEPKTPKRKKGRLLSWAILAAAGIVIIVAAVLCLRLNASVQGVLVSDETELIEVTTVEEFTEALSDLIAQYDTDLVVSGQQSTNRLLLVFEGDGIDLSAFPAATVIADEENYVVIQFETDEDAEACLEALQQTEGIVFVQEDAYSDWTESTAETTSSTVNQSVSSVPYTSSYTGYTYYTWGVEFMGLDQLAAWVMTQQIGSVVVAVLDTGCEPHDETADRILEGADMTGTYEESNGQLDKDGHGTHVSSTILDCTQGLDISILPVQVLNEDGEGAQSWIIQGIRYAIEQGVDVINMSLGGSENAGKDYWIEKAIEAGISVVVSAGNEAADTEDSCPAHIEAAIVVSACDSDGMAADFSNYGESVDVCAPGVDILSYYIDGQMAWMDGTSMAAPHISALVAIMRLYLTDATPAQLEKYITDYCIELEGSAAQSSDEKYYGAGIPWAAYLAGE